MAGEQVSQGGQDFRRVDTTPLRAVSDVPDRPGRRSRWELRLNDARTVFVSNIRSARLLRDMSATPTGTLTTAEIAERFNFSDFKGLDELVTTTQKELAKSGVALPFSPQGFSLRDLDTGQRLKVMQTTLVLKPPEEEATPAVERKPIPYSVVEKIVAIGDAHTIDVLRRVNRLLLRTRQTPESIRELYGIVRENSEILLANFSELPGYRNVFDALRDSATMTHTIAPSPEEPLVRLDEEGNLVYRAGSRLAALSEPVAKRESSGPKKKGEPKRALVVEEETKRRDPNMLHVRIAGREEELAFDRRRKDIVVIDSERRDVEPLELFLKSIRQRYGLSIRAFARFAELPYKSYSNVELGISTKIDTNVSTQIISAVRRLTENGDAHAAAVENYLVAMDSVSRGPQATQRREQLREEIPYHGLVVFLKDGEVLDLRTEDQKMYRLFDSGNYPFKQEVRYVRLASNFSRIDFARQTGLSRETLKSLEVLDRVPTLTTLNALIDGSILANDGYAAQRWRLKALGMEPITVEEFLSKSRGARLDYLRALDGLTYTKLADKLPGKSKETKRRALQNDHIGTDLMEEVCEFWLNKPEDIYIKDALLAERGELDEAIVLKMQKGKFLFRDIHPREDALPVVEVPEWIQQAGTLGAIISQMRANAEITQSELIGLLQGSKLTRQEISDIEHDKSSLYDVRIVAIFKAFGYDIYHPITQFVLQNYSYGSE